MTVYSGPVFEMATNQFNVIANHLEIPMDERDRPKNTRGLFP
jgi:glutamate dehydrogenase (NAD(P)+)